MKGWEADEIDALAKTVRGAVTAALESGAAVPVQAFVSSLRHPETREPEKCVVDVPLYEVEAEDALAVDAVLREVCAELEAEAVVVVAEANAVEADEPTEELLGELHRRGMLEDYPGSQRVAVCAVSRKEGADDLWILKIERGPGGVSTGEWEEMRADETAMNPLVGVLDEPPWFGDGLTAG